MLAMKALAVFLPWLENPARRGDKTLVTKCRTFLTGMESLLTREEATILLHFISERDKTDLSAEQMVVVLDIYKLLTSFLDGNRKRPREDTVKVRSIC